MWLGGKSAVKLHGLTNSLQPVESELRKVPKGSLTVIRSTIANMQRLDFSQYSHRASVSRRARYLERLSIHSIPRSRNWVAAGCLAVTLACSSAVGRGTTLYQQQNYIEAAEAFERTQERLVTMKPVERARYGLYRGLTFMALGDLRGAERWLDYADGQQRTQPSLLPAKERDLLARARRELSQRIHDSWPKPENSINQSVAASSVAGESSTVTR